MAAAKKKSKTTKAKWHLGQVLAEEVDGLTEVDAAQLSAFNGTRNYAAYTTWWFGAEATTYEDVRNMICMFAGTEDPKTKAEKPSYKLHQICWTANNQTLGIGWDFFASLVPQLTGTNICFASEHSKWAASCWTSTYKMHPDNTGKWKTDLGNVPWTGFSTYEYSTLRSHTNDDLETVESVIKCSDSSFLASVWQTGTTEMKFDFCCNRYSRKRVLGKGANILIQAEGNNEVLLIFKVTEGILCINWYMDDHPGDKSIPRCGSLRGYSSKATDFVNLMIENELISGGDDAKF